MNYLMLSVGRRGELLKNFRESMDSNSRIIATDHSPYAPALYFADKQYLVPEICDPFYIDTILEICKTENIRVVTTFIDPEIMLLSKNRDRFTDAGVEVLAPYEDTARIFFDKYIMFEVLKKLGINTPNSWATFDDTMNAIDNGEIQFPVFVKPRKGSGSVGARKVKNKDSLKTAFETDPSLIAQELMTGEGAFDLDADIYFDTISHKPVSIFLKRKISTTIGGANKTVSFKDDKLFDFIKEAFSYFKFNGPVDADFFYKDGKYYLSEVNPRFGGAYLHAYGAGVDFIKMINNNLNGIENKDAIGQYENGIVMLMYDSVVIGKENDSKLLRVLRKA